jgi:drug/metabolite transporter (DMT)-like permease
MSSLKRLLLMFALTAMWSPSFLFIKLAIHDIPPITLVCLRVSLGALILFCFLLYKKNSLPKDLNFWIRTTIMAFFSSVFPFCLFCYAEQSIDSSLAAILNGTSPMFTAILAQLFVASDRMNFQKVVGVIFSSLGLMLLFLPNLQAGLNSTSLGMLAATFASMSYAISHIFGKLYTTGQKPFVAPVSQLIVSSLMLWPFALCYDRVWTLPLPSLLSISAVCGLAIFGTSCAFIIYYTLLDHCGPTAISTVACAFPVMGMFLGFVFLQETFTFTALIGSGIIFIGMLCVNEIISIKPKAVSIPEKL